MKRWAGLPMDPSRMNWDDLRLFAAVARSGGLAAARRETGRSAPTLGRRMLALERALGVELFRRHAAGYDLTERGRDLLTRIETLGPRIARIVEAAAEPGPQLVKVSAGTWVTSVLCERAAALIGREGGVVLRFIAAEHTLDIVHREAVVGIRNQRPTRPGLAGRKVGRVRFAGYALTCEALPWIAVKGDTPSARWLAEQPGPFAPVEVTNPQSALDLAAAGIGRTLLPTFIGERRADLVRVGEPVAALAHDQWLVTHHEERHEPAVRGVISRVGKALEDLHRDIG